MEQSAVVYTLVSPSESAKMAFADKENTNKLKKEEGKLASILFLFFPSPFFFFRVGKLKILLSTFYKTII